MKGRDVMALLSLLPGVQDTNLNRDFAQWRRRSTSRSTARRHRARTSCVDGINIVDEGGCGTAFVNPNIDAIGEVQVIANGYTAENGRNNGGLINFVTKSGTSTFEGLGLVQRPARRVERERLLPQVAQGRRSRSIASTSRGYSVGGPVIIPGVLDSRTGKRSGSLLLRVAGIHRRRAADGHDDASNLPTELERRGNFSQTRITNGTIQPIIDPRDRPAVPGQRHSRRTASTRSGQKMLSLLPPPNGILNPAAGQEWTSNSAFDLTPEHGRTNHVLRMDAVLTDKTRADLQADQGPRR